MILSALLLLLQAAPARAGDLGVSATAGGAPLAGRPSKSVLGALEMEESDWIAEPFDAVLLHGTGADGATVLQVSRAGAAAAWGPWVTASLHRHPGGRFWAKARFVVARAGRVRVRAAGGASSLEFFAIETFHAVEKEERPASPSHAAPPPPADAAPAEPAVIERAAWGAKPPHEDYLPLLPARFTQHHTAGKHTTDLQESLAEMRFLQEFHQMGRGWNDIGYHYLIDGAGRVFRGRPLHALGAHVKGHNEGNIGISLMGNYHPPYNDQVTPAQREAIRRLGVWLRDRYAVSPSTYRGHRDYNPATDCPGDVTYALLPSIQLAIEAAPGPIAAALRRLAQRADQMARIISPAATR